MKILKRFWAWYTDPKVMGHGTVMGDWMTEQEKAEYLNGPDTPAAFNYWLTIAQNRKGGEALKRNFVTLIFVVVPVILIFIFARP